MKFQKTYRLQSALLVWLLCFPVVARSEIAFEASWQPLQYEQVREKMLAWLDSQTLGETVAFETRSMWPAGNLRGGDGSELLERVVETIAECDPQAKTLLDECNSEFTGPLPPQAAWLLDAAEADFVRSNLRLYYARWLAQHQLYDEVITMLAELKTDDVVDPAGLLFYRMVAHHQLVEAEQSRLALVRLLEQEQHLPRRYLQVAQLLKSDLAGLKDESLDHVARRMNDVRRRLDIGRAGKQVQVIEKGVVDSLDKLIKKLEEQQQQQQSSQSGGGQQSAQPMQDSQLPSMRAPMKVDQRDIGNKSGWGNLPPKQREQALQQIGREYPAHYRELIEQYFRKLADESSEESSR